MSHNFMGLHSLLRGKLYLFFKKHINHSMIMALFTELEYEQSFIFTQNLKYLRPGLDSQ
jgi:hypothetical protein